VSEGGWDAYPAAMASRPLNGPAGTPTKRIVASGVKRSAKEAQSPDRYRHDAELRRVSRVRSRKWV
jgi:hypothetical protein